MKALQARPLAACMPPFANGNSRLGFVTTTYHSLEQVVPANQNVTALRVCGFKLPPPVYCKSCEDNCRGIGCRMIAAARTVPSRQSAIARERGEARGVARAGMHLVVLLLFCLRLPDVRGISVVEVDPLAKPEGIFAKVRYPVVLCCVRH